MIASIEHEIETMKSSANSSSIETKLKLEEETAALKEKIKEIVLKNKDLQRQVNESGRKIENLSNNPEESKELKMILEELRTGKERLKELETRYSGEKQRSQMIQSKIAELEKEAKDNGIDLSSLNQPKQPKLKLDEESESINSKKFEEIKGIIAELEKNKQSLISQTKKKTTEIEEAKASIVEEIARSGKVLKDKDHECKLKEYEIKELKRTIRNLQTKLASVPDIHIDSNNAETKKKEKNSKFEAKEEDKPKEIKTKARQLSIHEEEKREINLINEIEDIEKEDNNEENEFDS